MTLVIMEAVSMAAVAMPREHRALLGKSTLCAAQYQLPQSLTSRSSMLTKRKML